MCRVDSGTSLWPDGTFTMRDGYGHWSLSGNVLTTEQVHPPTWYDFIARLGNGGQFRIWIAGPDRIQVQGIGAPELVASTIFPMYRCE